MATTYAAFQVSTETIGHRTERIIWDEVTALDIKAATELVRSWKAQGFTESYFFYEDTLQTI